MKTYGIETKWNGTVIYVLGEYESIEAATKDAKNHYKWYDGTNKIVECSNQ